MAPDRSWRSRVGRCRAARRPRAGQRPSGRTAAEQGLSVPHNTTPIVHNTTPIVHNTTAIVHNTTAIVNTTAVVVLALLIVACHRLPRPSGPAPQAAAPVVIRVNQVGYPLDASKVAVVCALESREITSFRVVDTRNRTVFGPAAARATGPFGPCVATYRLDFSGVRQAGVYRVVAGDASSLPVRIGRDVYDGAADSLLAYLREQRSGYNPVFRDSVHQRTDAILVDHPTRSGAFIPVSGGWADASDYLQYGATTAHATTMLLLAYRDHPGAFSDRYQANGLPGANGIADVLDEARWGLEWLLEMYPEDDLLLNQLGDDRDHAFWDVPAHDSSDYGWGRGGRRPGALSGLTPEPFYLTAALQYAALEPVSPWMGQDTARHYQWYPWHNNGHYEIWREGPDSARRVVAEYYGRGLNAVARRADNGFRVGIPFIWCSNNLLASFATQARFYRRMTGDSSYLEYETAALDWLFGTNPWGVSMVIGLGTTYPRTPHSVVAQQLGLQLSGGLVDGPVYRSIFEHLQGIRLLAVDVYAPFNTGFIVYHDDVGDYSTNEPVMDGTANLAYVLAARAPGAGPEE